MDTISYVALSRQMALDRHMTTLATNIANASSTGYRARHTLFEAELERAGPQQRVAFVQDVGQWQDTAPGPIATTGNQLDVAIDGSGFLAFNTAGGVRYSRAGHLTLDPQGQITDEAGHPVLDQGGQPLLVPAGAGELTIAADGTLSTKAGPIGRLQVVTFQNEQLLSREGDGLYRSPVPPQAAGGEGRLVQGALEGADVQPVMEMTSMMQATRLFEGTQKMIDTHHELEMKAIDGMISAHA